MKSTGEGKYVDKYDNFSLFWNTSLWSKSGKQYCICKIYDKNIFVIQEMWQRKGKGLKGIKYFEDTCM